MSVKILMVCLGNICRSPLAEGILANKLPKDIFIVDSAGTGNYHVGSPPDKRSILTAKQHGLDISLQRARQFGRKDFENFDYIFVMDGSNYDNVIELAKTEDERKKVDLILNQLFPNENVDVPDPYFGLQNGFEDVYQMLDEACEILAKKLIEKHA
ncbi:low molecular weight protein-tyrosine-phosphatase [Flavobacterium sp.]|jgi:protein-tyrosine phosphatase|uniref:low molecular weight protein-tyrosine-phosphatase n=1 Tax=Flavobacterium sp. TaxID=239 RepID=UPI0035AF899C